MGLGEREEKVVLQGGGEGVVPTPVQVVCSLCGSGRHSQSEIVTRPVIGIYFIN